MKKNFLLLLIAITFFANCETWRSQCNGEIIIENTIPDTTLYVNGEEYRRDISDSPRVFKHTENERIRIQVTAEDLDVVGAGVGIDSDNENHIIKVVPRASGTSKITVIGMDDCEGRAVPTSFNVTVLDTTQ